MKKDLTIIVPIYKIKEQYLRECLDSLTNQNKDNIYIILIDDGSPDNCGSICDEYANSNKNITVIHQKNSGVSCARNAGIKCTKTEWLTFVDPDDWVDSNSYELLLKQLDEDIDILMYPYTSVYSKKNIENIFSLTDHLLSDEEIIDCKSSLFFKNKDRKNGYSITALWNKIYKTSFIKNNNFSFIPEAKKGQDRLFNANVFCHAGKIKYVNKGMYFYRHYNESVTHKYNKNIIDLTLIEINELKRINESLNLNFSNLIDALTCTRLYSCIRLYLFNKSNKNSWKQKKKELTKLLNNSVFGESLNRLDWGLLSLKEKMFLMTIKLRLYLLCYLMIRIIEKKNY